MRELKAVGWRCARCGADARLERAEADGRDSSRPLAARACAALFTGQPRERSGLAYAAGFAGLLYLFRLSAGAMGWEWFGIPAAAVGAVWSAAAPAAMALSVAAVRDLERAPHKSGKAQALLGYLLGFWGTLWLCGELLFRP